MAEGQDIKIRALKRLTERRASLQAAYDALVGEPASYGITGSVSATNQRMTDLRREIAAIDDKITALLAKGGVSGIQIKLPDYHCPYMHVTEALDGRG